MVGADGQSMIMQRQEKVNCTEGRQRSANSGEIWVSFNACQKLGIKPTYRKWNGKGSLVSFVVSLNLHRTTLE
jgi:hypothetical protein